MPPTESRFPNIHFSFPSLSSVNTAYTPLPTSSPPAPAGPFSRAVNLPIRPHSSHAQIPIPTRPRTSNRNRRTAFLAIIAGAFIVTLHVLFSPALDLGEYRETISTYTEKLDAHAQKYNPWRVDKCVGWDHEAGEGMDPEGCMRARRYRQVKRVLDREVLGEHDHWWFTRDANIETLTELLQCYLPAGHANATECPDEPVIINGYWWSALTLKEGTSGEVIWQEPILKQFDQQGVRSLFMGPFVNWVEVAEMMPDVYRFAWVIDTELVSCVTDPRCVAKEHYRPTIDGEDASVGVPEEEMGVIPLWKMQVVDYWGALPTEISHNDHYWRQKVPGDWSYHPLGNLWVSTPWALPGHVHLPYSIEEHCLKQPYNDPENRTDEVLILAKKSSYFGYDHVVPPELLTNLSSTYNVISPATLEDDFPLPPGVKLIPRPSRDEYEELVGRVRVMLGIGHPPISPSVYTALCQGTPVVMPHRDPKLKLDGPKLDFKGWEKFSGRFQHGPAMAIGPPYVYSYFFKNYTQLEHAVHLASSTPIHRFIPIDMTLPFVKRQSRAFLIRDLRKMFDNVVAHNQGDIPRIRDHIRSRCFELGRCRGLKEGRRPSVPLRVGRE